MLIRDLVEETYAGYISRLVSTLKIDQLGQGYYARVFQHPKFKNVAVKIFITKRDPDYLEYARWCQRNQNNPWVPKIISIETAPIDADEDNPEHEEITIVFFEKLRPAEPEDIQRAAQEFIKDLPDTVITWVFMSFFMRQEVLQSPKSARDKIIADVRDSIAGFKRFEKSHWSEIAKHATNQHIKALASKLAKFKSTDIHQDNLMVRDDGSNQLVFTDPVASYE